MCMSVIEGQNLQVWRWSRSLGDAVAGPRLDQAGCPFQILWPGIPTGTIAIWAPLICQSVSSHSIQPHLPSIKFGNADEQEHLEPQGALRAQWTEASLELPHGFDRLGAGLLPGKGVGLNSSLTSPCKALTSPLSISLSTRRYDLDNDRFLSLISLSTAKYSTLWNKISLKE